MASIDAIDRDLRAEMSERERAKVGRWDELSTKEILVDAWGDDGLRKYAAFRVERRAPDREAAEWVREEYERGRLPAWEAAWLLGSLGHEAGYETVRAILADPPEHAVPYAGVALAILRGAEAEPELIALVNESETKATRASAAAGLMHLGTPSAARALFDAARAGRVSIRAIAASVSRVEGCHERIERSLAAADLVDVALAAEIVFALIKRAARGDATAGRALESHRERWRAGVRAAAARSEVSLGPHRREALLRWGADP